MEVTDQLNDHSYSKNYDDCFKEKKFIITKYIRFFFYCTVFFYCLSVTYLLHTSEEGTNLLNMIEQKKVWSFILLLIMFSAYVMFLFRNE